MRPSKALKEMLHADREMIRLGISILKMAVLTTVLVLLYVGLAGAFTQGEQPVALLGAISAMSRASGICPVADSRTAQEQSGHCRQDLRT